MHLRDRQAVADLLQRDVAVTICTGRMYSGTRAIAESLKLRVPVACVDGCHVVHSESHQDLVRHHIESEVRKILHGLLCKTNLAVFAFAKDIIVHDVRGAQYADYLRTWSNQMNRVRDLFEPSSWEALDEVTSLVIIGSEQDTRAAVEAITAACAEHLQLAHFPLLRAPMSHRWVVLIRRAGITKGTAVTWMAQYFGVDLKDVMVVGDWLNDLPMFAVAGHSFVMGQAPDEVKSAARYQLKANSHTGGAIAEVAEICGLL